MQRSSFTTVASIKKKHNYEIYQAAATTNTHKLHPACFRADGGKHVACTWCHVVRLVVLGVPFASHPPVAFVLKLVPLVPFELVVEGLHPALDSRYVRS